MRFLTSNARGHSCLTLAAVLLMATTAAAQSPVIQSIPSLVPAGPDFATDVLANPWDFADEADLSPFPDELGGWTISSSTARTIGRRAFLAGGTFSARTSTDGNNMVPLLYRGGPGMLASANENVGIFDHKAIPTARFGKLAVAVTLSASTAPNSQLVGYWFSSPYGGANERAAGAAFRVPKAGTHIYIVDLVTGAWTDERGNPGSPSIIPAGYPMVAWNGVGLMRGFALRVTSDGTASVNVSVDWARLTQRDGAAGAATLPVSFSGCSGRDYSVEVQAAGGSWEVVHTGTAGGSATTTAQVNYGVLPPGAWSFRVTCYTGGRANGTPSSSSPAGVTINQPPIVAVHNPDALGGTDYATTVTGDGWDFNAMSDVATTYGVADASIVSDGVTNALQATATSGDPIVVLRTGAPIDTQRFRNLTFALTLDTAFGLDGAAGDGSVARVIWHTPSGAVTVSKDIPVWPGRNLYTIDLSRLTTASGLEPSSQAAWSSSIVSILRIDPHESTKGVRFRLGTTVLTAPDEVVLGSAAAVQFAFADSDTAGSSYQARIYLDADRVGDGRVLLDTFAATPNVLQTYQFIPAGRGVPAGEYFFYVEVTETRGGFSDTRGLYSSGPLRVLASEPASPPPSSAPGAPFLRPLQTGQNPAAVAWSPGAGGAPTFYTVAAGTSPGASNLGVFNVGAVTAVSGNVPERTPIYVRVTAHNAAGAATSNEISFQMGVANLPGAPTMNAPLVSGRTVTLSWNPPPSGAPPALYTLVVRYPGNPTIIATYDIFALGVQVPNAPPGDYIVTVVARSAAGIGPESAGVLVSVR